MAQHYLPPGMSYTTLEERKQFYTKEFNLQKVAGWFVPEQGKIRFAVIIGRHTKIYPEKYKKDANTKIIIDEYQDLKDVQGQILEFLPEAVYYDRNTYDECGCKTGQELAFDLDPENITCPIHGTLTDKMKQKQVLSFCELELEMVKKEAAELFEFLQRDFSELKIVYSGRGFHIYVFDLEAFMFTPKQRADIAKKVKGAGFHIDAWITEGEMRLIRLPFSLNGLVSRIVLPLRKEELESFDPVKDKRCVPKFLGKKLTF